MPKVLAVDDDPWVAESLREYLEDFGFEVETEASAERALALLLAHHYDVAIIDLTLPDMSGEELIVRAKENAGLTAFLIVTGLVSYSLSPRLLQLGLRPEHVFQKPMPDLSRLVSTLERLTAEVRAVG